MQHKSGPAMQVEDVVEIIDDSDDELTVVRSNIMRDYSQDFETSYEMEAQEDIYILLKMGGNFRTETCRYADQVKFVGPNGHCRICDLDFRSTLLTVDHIINDHFDVATGRKSGNQRCVFQILINKTFS